MRKTIFLFILVCFIGFLPAGILAQDSDLPSAGLTPDSPFYFLKAWKEKIQIFFTFGEENKAKQFLHLSEVRLAEYQKMIEKGKTEIAQKTLEKYEKQLNQAIEKADRAQGKGKDVTKLKEEISEKILKHQEVLKSVLEKVPEEAKEGIEKIKTKTEERIRAQEEELRKAEERIKELEEKLKEKEVPKEIPKKIEEKPTAVSPKEPVPSQELISGEIQLDLSGIGDENVKSYLTAWYNKTYPILKNITGGPCQPFKASVNYSSVGGGGQFLSSSLGQDATIIFGMPLDDSTRNGRFDSRFGHEFSHSFMNGIRAFGIAPRGGQVSASFIKEGFAESVISSALFELFKAGQTSYKGIGFYLPYVVASYDSYAIQGKDIAGGALMWKAEYTGYYYEQAEAVWYLLEQTKPGFVKEFMKETCSLPKKSIRDGSVIELNYDQFKEILTKIFGSIKIEGMNITDWFNAQPITNINGASGVYIRIQFDGKTGIGSDDEGRSINPGKITITAVERIQDPGEGPKDTKLSVTPVVKLTNWQSQITNLELRSSGKPASAIVPALSEGAYKVEVSDSNLNAKTATYFIVTPTIDEGSLYGIKLNNGEIVSSGTIKSSLGDTQITNGFFKLKVPENIQEVNFPDNNRTVIKPAGMARMIILP